MPALPGATLPDTYALVRRQMEVRALPDIERRVPLIHVAHGAIRAEIAGRMEISVIAEALGAVFFATGY